MSQRLGRPILTLVWNSLTGSGKVLIGICTVANETQNVSVADVITG